MSGQTVSRRELLWFLGWSSVFAGGGSAVRAQAAWPRVTTFGDARAPVLVSVASAGEGLTPEAIAPLLRDYRVVLVNLEERALVADEVFTAEWLCTAILDALTRAGVDRFAWYGFSFGAVVGLQVATRTPRTRALLCGGWPPLGAQYRETLAVLDARAARGEANLQTRRFYQSLQNWPERAAVAALTVPRAVFAGTEDQFEIEGQRIHIGPSVAEHRAELERLGWRVEMIDGVRHNVGSRPDIIVPIVQRFLDSVTSR